MQTKDIPTQPILQFLVEREYDVDKPRGGSANAFGIEFENGVAHAFPEGTAERLVISKMGKLIKQGLVDGTARFRCRGDFRITKAGKVALEKMKHDALVAQMQEGRVVTTLREVVDPIVRNWSIVDMLERLHNSELDGAIRHTEILESELSALAEDVMEAIAEKIIPILLKRIPTDVKWKRRRTRRIADHVY